MSEPIAAQQLTIIPANEASWDDLQALFGRRGTAARCQCQRPTMKRAVCSVGT
jgi:hypothetical protein